MMGVGGVWASSSRRTATRRPPRRAGWSHGQPQAQFPADLHHRGHRAGLGRDGAGRLGSRHAYPSSGVQPDHARPAHHQRYCGPRASPPAGPRPNHVGLDQDVGLDLDHILGLDVDQVLDRCSSVRHPSFLHPLQHNLSFTEHNPPTLGPVPSLCEALCPCFVFIVGVGPLTFYPCPLHTCR